MWDRAKIAFAIGGFLALFGFLVFQAGVASHHPQNQSRQVAATQDHEQKNILERFWEWTTDDPVAVYTLVLAFSTIGLWFVTARGVRTQIADTRILQRAYISVEPAGIHAHHERWRELLRGEKGPLQSVPHVVINNSGN